MTELISVTRLRQMEGLTNQSGLVLRPVVPVLRWATDVETGRPASHWVLAETQQSPDLLPTTGRANVWHANVSPANVWG
jgi:hypothetical protein